MSGEELHRLVDAHREHIADRLAAPLYRQRLAVEPAAAAHVAEDLHVRQEAHLDLLQTLAFAGVAAAAGGVEREPARGVAADPRLGRLGEEAADRIPEADVRRRARARRLADRRLVDLEDAADELRPVDRLAAAELAVSLARAPLAEQRDEICVQHVAGERRLAGPRNAGDHREAAERNARGDALPAVPARAAARDRPRAAGHR